jgi:uncharacterized circularly permuted ATP-grasp superfamily protein
VFQGYDTEGFFDETFSPAGEPRPAAAMLTERIRELGLKELHQRQEAAERSFLHSGITFNVYGSDEGTEKIWPFDIIPRIIDASEWDRIEHGLRQRVTALNQFIHDVYNDRKIINDKVVPADLVLSSKTFREGCVGLSPPNGIWCHITGTDLVRDGDGQLYVLEDNLRCPSGVSYVLENRRVMKQTFPQLFATSPIRPVDDYPSRLLEALQNLASHTEAVPKVVLLTPGVFNSAFFEHAFLARQMGIELVEGRDLTVSNGFVYIRTTSGFERVDVIYRRVDDDFLDPDVFRADSLLGVKGLMQVFREGRVALANAPGTGIADDKAIYSFVPDIVKYYLGEEIILPNVPTYVCSREEDLKFVLAHLDELVVKPTDESGGYGLLVGPHASQKERKEFAKRIQADPRKYIAQPTLALSRCPVIVEDRCEGRHVDLRPFILMGEDVYVLPGGLTRVALQKGSLIVNSSQGGGSKDTWALS